jgi:hypothetical protein
MNVCNMNNVSIIYYSSIYFAYFLLNNIDVISEILVKLIIMFAWINIFRYILFA